MADGKPNLFSLSVPELAVSFWVDAWKEGLWAASWSASLAGLTPEQAAWSPAPGRHSIWQIVLHMTFWRNEAMSRARTGVRASADEVNRSNFPAITDPSPAAWESAKQRLFDSQSAVAAMLRAADPASQNLIYLIPHDSYHFGQVNYLRAMLGLKPIE